MAGLMNKEAPGGRTSLPGGSNGSKQDRTYSHLHIGCLIDNDGIVSAEFEEGPTQSLADRGRYPATHRDRSGKRNERQSFILHHLFREGRLVGETARHPSRYPSCLAAAAKLESSAERTKASSAAGVGVRFNRLPFESINDSKATACGRSAP